MENILLLVLVGLAVWWLLTRKKTKVVQPSDLSILPERFVVFDLETTGLKAGVNEIIEIGAIRVNRDSDNHDTFQTFVVPKGRIGKRISELTGITSEMVEAEGISLENAVTEFRQFVGDLPLVAFNAPFDEAFLSAACSSVSVDKFTNEVYCALNMARRAWPGRSSYRLQALANDGNLSNADTHRALGDCRRAMIVYAAAASELGTHR